MCKECSKRALEIDARTPHFIDVLNRKQPESGMAWRDNQDEMAKACHEYRAFVDGKHPEKIRI